MDGAYKSFIYSLLAGILGSCGSIAGKLSGSFQEFFSSLKDWSYVVELLFFTLMIVCNVVGCTFYTKSLDACSNSLQPTMISFASNYLFSALATYVLFNNATSWLWWLGTCLTFSGLITVLKSQKGVAIKQD